MKEIVYRKQLNEEELVEMRKIASAFSLCEEAATVLYTRGVKDVSSARAYLYAGKKNFVNPFTLKNMDVLVSRLNVAKENGETVVVFGDYDADGVCATSIMVRALAHEGINVIPVLPEREDGYGLSEEMIDRIAGEYFPDLLITVDCGISNKNEVEMLLDAGIDVIVTDHHELPEELPSVPVINPKLPNQEYPYDNLCGAGVAFKIACALCGEWAYTLVDFACLATVADSMTVTGENRDIIAEGLKLFESSALRPQFKLLLSGSREISETALAFTVAPRLNAAGRMGDVASALQLFLTEDEAEMASLANLLAEYNVQRQVACDEMYRTAKTLLLQKGAYTPAIVLYSPEWKAGFLGIVASRLAEEYARPVILFCSKGEGVLKGSVRSVERINIYEAISAVKEYTVEFGGHAQAAGVSVLENNLSAFETALYDQIMKIRAEGSVLPTVHVEKQVTEPFTMELAKDLKRLEPFGVGNRKPLYVVEVGAVATRPLKAESPHLSLSTPVIDALYFGGEKYADILKNPVKKSLIFEPNISVFNKKESLKAYIREFIPSNQYGEECRLAFFRKTLAEAKKESLSFPAAASKEETENALHTALQTPYGTLVVCQDPKNMERFASAKLLPAYAFASNFNNLHNSLLLAPDVDADTQEYHTVIYLDTPLSYAGKFRGQTVVMHGVLPFKEEIMELSLNRAEFSKVFTAVKTAGKISAFDGLSAYRALGGENPYQVIFAVECFLELGIFETFGGTLAVNKQVKNPLENSKIYQTVKKLQEEL
ncbi:MAG: single-stranded-DNA-specific exonuclease RecJ [Clostridiales bacterium]|nr:single-stranded-DNA-specific exonuclease RecJ [Clostridiales bacterium]